MVYSLDDILAILVGKTTEALELKPEIGHVFETHVRHEKGVLDRIEVRHTPPCHCGCNPLTHRSQK